MRVRLGTAQSFVGVLLATFSGIVADAASSADQAPSVAATDSTARAGRLRWLTELAAESFETTPAAPRAAAATIPISLPGAAYVFAAGPDGALRKRVRLAADAAAPHGLAVTTTGIALADKQGTVGLWALAPGAEPSPRWRRDLGDRVASVGWDGGELVLVATWKGRLAALGATDGRIVWSTDIGGKADAPAVIDGTDVYVATKARTLLRIATATGAVSWKVSLPGVAVHPPTGFGAKPRLVVCGTWDGQLLAHDAATGKVRWSVGLPGKLAAAPLATPDGVAAVTADGAVHAYDPAGGLRWSAQASAEGPATLLLQARGGAGPRLLAVSKILVGLDLTTGARLADYPQGAVETLRRRFADAMLDGVKTYSEAEKRAALDREAFDITGPLFGTARLLGSHLAFGTEDGWAFVFDADSLRPVLRHRAGQPSIGAPRLAAGRALAVAGEEVFGLDSSTGKTVWKRVLGAEPGRIAGEETLGIVAGERVHAVAAADGDLRWSLRSSYKSVAPATTPEDSKSTPWVVDDGQGNLRALLPPGRLVGDPLPAGTDLLPVVATGPRSWVIATRDGKILVAVWEPAPSPESGTATDQGRLLAGGESSLGEPIAELQVAEGRILARTEAGAVVGFDATTLQEGWRIRVTREERLQASPRAGALFALGAEELRAYDWGTGELKLLRKVAAPPVGADLRGGTLRWLDRWGGAHRVEGAEGAVVSSDLGLSLAAATPAPGGFLVTTAAGEVGFVEMADGTPSGSGNAGSQASGSQARGERP